MTRDSADIEVTNPDRACLLLLHEQIDTAVRVMAGLGHITGYMCVPDDASTLLVLSCQQCGEEATIHLLEAAPQVRYTVLLLPRGVCNAVA